MPGVSTDNDFMITLQDLAAFAGISTQALHKYIKKNGFQPVIVNKRAYMLPEETRKLLIKRRHVFQRKTISFQMLKGGCSKTTTALNVGIRANMYGARVLLIDLDQQANLSFSFGLEDPDAPVWIDLAEDSCTIEDIIVKVTPTLHVIPSNLNNSLLDKTLLSGTKNISKAISKHLSRVTGEYDLILIDTAPNLSAINTAAACASDTVILPVTPDKFAFSGLSKTLNDLESIKDEFRASFATKVLFTKFDGRETASHELLKLCLANHSNSMLKAFIRVSSDIKNTIRSRRTIFSRKTTAKEDYDLLTREVLLPAVGV